MSWKLSCPMWSGGKLEDNIKELPIAIKGPHPYFFLQLCFLMIHNCLYYYVMYHLLI